MKKRRVGLSRSKRQGGLIVKQEPGAAKIIKEEVDNLPSSNMPKLEKVTVEGPPSNSSSLSRTGAVRAPSGLSKTYSNSSASSSSLSQTRVQQAVAPPEMSVASRVPTWSQTATASHRPEVYLRSLNEDQYAAAVYPPSPLMIIAGPGSGKTNTITHRIVHLVLSGQALPQSILAMTFTNKAAHEMKERAAQTLVANGYVGSSKPCISTFHAFGMKIIHSTMREHEMSTNLNIANTAKQRAIIREILNERYDVPLPGETKKKSKSKDGTNDPNGGNTDGKDTRFLYPKAPKDFQGKKPSELVKMCEESIAKMKNTRYNDIAAPILRGHQVVARYENIRSSQKKKKGNGGSKEPTRGSKKKQKGQDDEEERIGIKVPVREQPNYLNEWFKNPGTLFINEVFTDYQRRLASMMLIDFGDILVLLYALLVTYEHIKRGTGYRYQHILVDEFQDTNHLQYAIIRLLTEAQREVKGPVVNPDGSVSLRHPSIVVVGDPDQSIYSWRYAYPKCFSKFQEDYNADFISLTVNYRSSKTIICATEDVMKGCQEQRPYAIRSSTPNGSGSGVVVQQHSKVGYNKWASKVEAQFVVHSILKLKKEIPSLKNKDFAVLCRTSFGWRDVEQAFLSAGILYTILGGTSMIERVEAMDLFCMAELAMNPLDMLALTRAIGIKKVERVGDGTIRKVMRFFTNNGLSTLDLAKGASLSQPAEMVRTSPFSMSPPNDFPILESSRLAERLKRETRIPDKMVQNIAEVCEIVHNLREANLEGKDSAETMFLNIYEQLNYKSVIEERCKGDDDKVERKVKFVYDLISFIGTIDAQLNEERAKATGGSGRGDPNESGEVCQPHSVSPALNEGIGDSKEHTANRNDTNTLPPETQVAEARMNVDQEAEAVADRLDDDVLSMSRLQYVFASIALDPSAINESLTNQGHSEGSEVEDGDGGRRKVTKKKKPKKTRGKNDDAVTISTIHRAKGLEWPVVLLPKFQTGVIPHPKSSTTNCQKEEERRLAYVAFSRAKSHLLVSFEALKQVQSEVRVDVDSDNEGEDGGSYTTKTFGGPSEFLKHMSSYVETEDRSFNPLHTFQRNLKGRPHRDDSRWPEGFRTSSDPSSYSKSSSSNRFRPVPPEASMGIQSASSLLRRSQSEQGPLSGGSVFSSRQSQGILSNGSGGILNRTPSTSLSSNSSSLLGSSSSISSLPSSFPVGPTPSSSSFLPASSFSSSTHSFPSSTSSSFSASFLSSSSSSFSPLDSFDGPSSISSIPLPLAVPSLSSGKRKEPPVSYSNGDSSPPPLESVPQSPSKPKGTPKRRTVKKERGRVKEPDPNQPGILSFFKKKGN